MEFSIDDLQVLSIALNQLLDLHISSDYEVEELCDRIDSFLSVDYDED